VWSQKLLDVDRRGGHYWKAKERRESVEGADAVI
jgi:hypothetical protein